MRRGKRSCVVDSEATHGSRSSRALVDWDRLLPSFCVVGISVESRRFLPIQLSRLRLGFRDRLPFLSGVRRLPDTPTTIESRLAQERPGTGLDVRWLTGGPRTSP